MYLGMEGAALHLLLDLDLVEDLQSRLFIASLGKFFEELIAGAI